MQRLQSSVLVLFQKLLKKEGLLLVGQETKCFLAQRASFLLTLASARDRPADGTVNLLFLQAPAQGCPMQTTRAAFVILCFLVTADEKNEVKTDKINFDNIFNWTQ